MNKIILTILFLIFSNTVFASEKFILVGGGPTPQSSEYSIESNVIWIKNILKSNSVKEFPIIFASGQSNIRDVKIYNSERKISKLQTMLYRIYRERNDEYFEYRRNTVANVSRPANRINVIQVLRNNLNKMDTANSVTLIYNGHGTYHPSDTSRNSLRLWGKTYLSVNDLRELIANKPLDTRLRFILPQCYSGAFSKVIFKDVKKSNTTIYENTCGFASVPENKESEGCTPYTNEYDYNDYLTFFFAALDRKTRTDQEITTNPDMDKNGEVSFREAHFYAVNYSISRDIPRTTSEVFLAQWEPWYLKWQSTSEIGEYEYNKAFNILSERIHTGMKNSDPTYIQHVNKLIKDVMNQKQKTNKKIKRLKTHEKMLKKKIVYEISIIEPKLEDHLKNNTIDMLNWELPGLVDKIESMSAYNELLDTHDRLSKLLKYQLELERKEGMFRRITRMQKISRLKKLFIRYANEKDQRSYQKLLACESTGLNN